MFADCLARARRHYDGDLVLIDTGSGRRWNRMLQRDVVSQSIAIFERITAMEVLLDRDGNAIGFFDEQQWRGCAAGEVSDEEALDLVRETGILDGALRIVERAAAERGAIELVVEEAGLYGETYRVTALVNPVLHSLISLLPATEERT